MNKQLTPQEVAPLLQISIPQLCRLTKAGKIPAKDMGIGKNHCWRYDPETIESWLRERPQATDSTVKRRNRKSWAA